MSDISNATLRREAERLGLTALLELDADAFRDAMRGAEILRTGMRRPESVFEEPLHVARFAAPGEAGAGE